MNTNFQRIAVIGAVIVLLAGIGLFVLRSDRFASLRARLSGAQSTPSPTQEPLPTQTPGIGATPFSLFGSPTPSPLFSFRTGTPVGTSRATGSPLATSIGTTLPTPTPLACAFLAATPATGTAPLAVRFTGVGLGTSVRQFEFNFGDTSVSNLQPVKQASASATYTYNNPGTYNASIKAFDSQNNQLSSTNDCRRTVVVRARPESTTGGNPNNLPKTGFETWMVFFLAPLAAFGVYIYKKYKLV